MWKHTHTHTHTHTHPFVYFSVYPYIYIKNHEFLWHLQSQSNYTGFVLASSLYIFIAPFSSSEKPGTHISSLTHTLFCWMATSSLSISYASPKSKDIFLSNYSMILILKLLLFFILTFPPVDPIMTFVAIFSVTDGGSCQGSCIAFNCQASFVFNLEHLWVFFFFFVFYDIYILKI